LRGFITRPFIEAAQNQCRPPEFPMWSLRARRKLDRLRYRCRKVGIMNRYILRFRGQGAKPAADVERIRSLPNATVLDDESARMLLVEAPADELQTAMASLPGWVMTEERMILLPDPRPRVRRKVVTDDRQ
jgi:hypothetical protein